MGPLTKFGTWTAGALLGIATLFTPKTGLETILAQDSKPLADTRDKKNSELTTFEPYKKIANYFTASATEFYTKAKDTQKTKEAANLALEFDSTNQEAKDLLKKVEKTKLKTDNKALKKAEENYGKNKEQAIKELYDNGVEKAKEDKSQAEEIFFHILKIDAKSKKIDDGLKTIGWKEINGYLLPSELAGAREKGKKYLAEASEGDEDKTEDDLVSSLKIENNKIFRRKSRDIIVRSTLDEESVKRAHKVSEATMRLLLEYLELGGKPPYNIGDTKSTDHEPTHRITILTTDDQMDKFAKSTTAFGYQKGVTIAVHESWELKRTQSYGCGHFHKFSNFGKSNELFDDQISSCTIESILDCSSNYVDSDTYVDSPWFFSSVVRNFTWQLLGTTLNRKILSRDDKYKGKIDGITSVETSEKLRAGAYLLAFENKLLPINTLSKIKFDQFTDQAQATAWAATEYFIHNHEDKLVALLTDEYHKKPAVSDSKYDIQKITGLTPEQFDKNVQKFVKRKYFLVARDYKE